MLLLLASLASVSLPLTYKHARELAFQTPYTLDADRRAMMSLPARASGKVTAGHSGCSPGTAPHNPAWSAGST